MYFETVVQCNCNLSAAAKKLHISESALSKNIVSFERKNKVQLFLRKKSRLSELTRAGEIVYAGCGDIIDRYDAMMKGIARESLKIERIIKIGITPVMLSLGFSKIINGFRMEYPDIVTKVVEGGTEELCKKIENQELDYAVLVISTIGILNDVKTYPVAKDNLVAIMSKDNPLSVKKKIHWKDLNGSHLTLYNDKFSINRMVLQKLNALDIKPEVILEAAHWDYLLGAIDQTDYITILPKLSTKLLSDEHVVREFDHPIRWEARFVVRNDSDRTEQEAVFIQFVLDHINSENCETEERNMEIIR